MFVYIRMLGLTAWHKRFKCSFCRDDLQPVAVRVFDKINAHRGVFKADAVHLAVQRVRGVKIVCSEGKMELAFAEVIFLRMVA